MLVLMAIMLAQIQLLPVGTCIERADPRPGGRSASVRIVRVQVVEATNYRVVQWIGARGENLKGWTVDATESVDHDYLQAGWRVAPCPPAWGRGR